MLSLHFPVIIAHFVCELNTNRTVWNHELNMNVITDGNLQKTRHCYLSSLWPTLDNLLNVIKNVTHLGLLHLLILNHKIQILTHMSDDRLDYVLHIYILPVLANLCWARDLERVVFVALWATFLPSPLVWTFK